MAQLFRQYSVVKNVVILKEQVSQGQHRHPKALAFVEFHSSEHAAYALQCSTDLKLDSFALKTSFAKESMMQQMIQQVRKYALCRLFPFVCSLNFNLSKESSYG